jgi:hypothetical protein
VAGSAGLAACGLVLWLLKSPELAEILGSFGRRLKGAQQIAVEPSDVA